MRRVALPLALGLCLSASAPAAPAQSLPSFSLAQNFSSVSALPQDPALLPAPMTRNGQEIFNHFREGLADRQCDAGATDPRWKKHFAHAPGRLGNTEDDVLALFGYVVDELRAGGLPTEFALIPFVESGYRPHARSPSGPAGLWQFIATTARNHNVPMEKGYDGRLSPVESTRAAVRYLKTLHGMFGGDWRLTVMAYNAGEYRILQAMRRGGMNAQNARPAELPGLSRTTYDYVEKLHALACVLEKVETQESVMAKLDRQVPILEGHSLPKGTNLQRWSVENALDPARIARLNPAGATVRAGSDVLAPRTELHPPTLAAVADEHSVAQLDAASTDEPSAGKPAETARTAQVTTAARRHTVRSGESAWVIARRHGITVKSLLALNKLSPNAILKPGMVLRL